MKKSILSTLVIMLTTMSLAQAGVCTKNWYNKTLPGMEKAISMANEKGTLTARPRIRKKTFNIGDTVAVKGQAKNIKIERFCIHKKYKTRSSFIGGRSSYVSKYCLGVRENKRWADCHSIKNIKQLK